MKSKRQLEKMAKTEEITRIMTKCCTELSTTSRWTPCSQVPRGVAMTAIMRLGRQLTENWLKHLVRTLNMEVPTVTVTQL